MSLVADSNVMLPAAVRAAAARAAAAHAAAYPAQEPAAEAQAAEAPAPEAAPVPTPNPAPAAAPPELRMDAVTPGGNSDEGSWERKYQSMRGRFEQMQRQNQQLSDGLAEAQRQIALLQAAAPAAPAPAELRAERLVTPQEEEEYGAEFLNVVERKARELVEPMAARLQQIESQVKGVGQVVEQDARAKTKSYLTAHVPNWMEINVSSDFLAWLALPDQYSGVIRRKLLEAAYARADGPTCAAFFNGYLKEAAGAPAASSAPSAPARGPRVSLESLAAPGRAKAAAPTGPATPEKPIIARSEIRAFYDAVTAGKYRGRDEEKRRIEVMIFEAQTEGRISD